MANDFILILDFGGSQAQSMARKLRGLKYYCEVHTCDIDLETIRRKGPKGLLLAGGPKDISFDPEILQLGIPVLAMGHCSRDVAKLLGASCEGALLTGRASEISFLPCPLFDGLGDSDRYFERIDALRLPEELSPIATTIDGLIPAFADLSKQIYALQFYAESNDPDGVQILENFAGRICDCGAFWSPEYYIDMEIRFLREKIGDGKAIMAVSGGVDSTVSAMLMHRAIGDHLRCVFVDNGLLRKGEAEMVAHTFREQLGLEPFVVDARDRVLCALRGVTDPNEKRRIIHNEFIAAMRQEANAYPGAEFFVEGTIYPDLLEGNGNDDGHLFSPLKRIEPIRMLFKDEVRMVGEALGISRDFLSRQPFPGSGLANRCIGEVTAEKLALLREADAIFQSEIVDAGLDRRLTHFFVVLTNTHTAGIRDGHASVEYACALRAINAVSATNISIAKLPYDLIERVVQRITGEVPGINHVLYDVTGRPTALAEWE